MSTQGQQSHAASPMYRIERVIASLVMAWVIILTTYMIFQDHVLSHESMYFLKIILSLSGAVMLATLPGFMDINYNVGGFSVRAAGGAAAFVFIYTQSPNLPALKLDPAQAKPAQNRSLPKSDNLSQLTNGFPTLMAFSLVAPGLLFSSASSQGGSSQSGGFAAGVNVVSSGGDTAVSGGLGGVSFVEAVTTDAATFAEKTSAYARDAARQLQGVLDTAAAALRGGVSRVAASISNLLGAWQTLGGAAPQGIALFSENLSTRADDLVSDLFGPEGVSAGALVEQVGGLANGLLGGLQNSGEGIVPTMDHTMRTLISAVQDSTHNVLDSTEKLAHGLTDVLDDATGGLTAGLTPTANRLVSGITSTAEQVMEGVTPAVANTASQLFDGVGDGVGHLTESLNAVSPALIAKIDPDFAAGHTLLQVPDRLDAAAPAPLLEKLGGSLGTLGSDREHGLLGSGGERNLFANKFADPLGGGTLAAGPTCIGGCGGGTVLSGAGGTLSQTVSGLGVGESRPLGSLNGGAISGGPVSSGSNGGGSAGGGSQGPISSALGHTGSVLGGATRLLGKR